MDSSTAAIQRGSPSAGPRQEARNSAHITSGRKRLPSKSVASSSKARKRTKATANPPPDGEDDDEFAPVANGKDKDGLLRFREHRPKGPFSPSPAHQLIYMRIHNRLPPRDVLQRPYHPMKSVAPPPQFDLCDLTIKLTAKEILTFFPNHVNILEIQQRFKESDIKGTFQAMFINRQHLLQGLEIFMSMDGRNWVKKVSGKNAGAVPSRPTTYTTSHYTFTPGGKPNEFDGIKIPYPVIDCAAHIRPCDFPTGPDSGPFTKALIRVQLTNNTTLMLSELDAYIAKVGIERESGDGYSDVDFKNRHVAMAEEYKEILKKQVVEEGFNWEG